MELMRVKNLRTFLTLARWTTVAAVGLSLGLAGLASAQEGPATTGLSVQPLRNEHSGDVGGELNGRIRVLNHSSTPLEVVLELSDFIPEVGTSGNVRLIDAGERSLRAWTDFFPVSMVLAPRGHQDVFYRLRVPHEALPGGYYGAIVARTNSPSATIHTGVASLLLITVRGPPGSLRYGAEATVLPPANGELVEQLPVTLGAIVSNVGNVHFKSGFRTLIVDWRGAQVAVLETPEDLNVLPGAAREISLTWEGGDNGVLPLFGRFVAVPQIRWGPDATAIELPPQTIWVIPYRWLGTLALILAIGGGALYLLSRGYARSLRTQVQKDMGEPGARRRRTRR